MRRFARNARLRESLPTTARLFPTDSVCLLCQHRVPFTTSSHRGADREKLPYLERTRRKIWGTDKPPGPEDVYSGESQLLRKEKDTGEARDMEEPRKEDVVTIGADEPLVNQGESEGVEFDPGERRRQARREEREMFQQSLEGAPSHNAYVPKQTWDGMEMVGGETEWNSGQKTFKGFLPDKKVTSPEEITVALYRAVVEVFAAQSAQLSLTRLKRPESGVLVNSTIKAEIAPSPSGDGCVIKFPSGQIRDEILDSIRPTSKDSIVKLPEAEEKAAETTGQAEPNDAFEAQEAHTDDTKQQTQDSNDFFEAQNALSESDDILEPPQTTRSDVQGEPIYTSEYLREHIQSLNQSWRRISLANPTIKLAVIRRFTQLTGQRVPDNILQTSSYDTSTNFLLGQLVRPPKPKTLYEALTTDRQDFVNLPNVQIKHRRETPVDKEKDVGRWKVIEQQLRSRGLPVLGNT